MNLLVPEQLRAWAFVALEDLESGLNFISACLDLKASRAEKELCKQSKDAGSSDLLTDDRKKKN